MLFIFQVTKIPAVPNVVQILEDYVKHYGLNELSNLNRKRVETEIANLKKNPNTQSKSIKTPVTSKPIFIHPQFQLTPEKSLATLAEEKKREEVAILLHDVALLKETIDSLRILFDHVLHQKLLYEGEREQFARSYDQSPHKPFDRM